MFAIFISTPSGTVFDAAADAATDTGSISAAPRT